MRIARADGPAGRLRFGRFVATLGAAALLAVVAWPAACDAVASVTVASRNAPSASEPTVAPAGQPQPGDAADRSESRSAEIVVNRVASAGAMRTKSALLLLVVCAVLVAALGALAVADLRALRGRPPSSLPVSASFHRRPAAPRGPPSVLRPVALGHPALRLELAGALHRRHLGGFPCSMLPTPRGR